MLLGSGSSQYFAIAPEAAAVVAAEFPDQIDYWQSAIGANISSLAGAKVLLIDGRDPWIAADKNAAIAGGYQQFGTRENGFFASYVRAETGWTYTLGLHTIFGDNELSLMKTFRPIRISFATIVELSISHRHLPREFQARNI